jgi:hypothetical protein
VARYVDTPVLVHVRRTTLPDGCTSFTRKSEKRYLSCPRKPGSVLPPPSAHRQL